LLTSCPQPSAGGGAFKYTELFRERLGVVLEKEDEMSCAVAGANFLLQAIQHEAFTYENSAVQFVQPGQGALAFNDCCCSCCFCCSCTSGLNLIWFGA
jgi:pantothenate kinase